MKQRIAKTTGIKRVKYRTTGGRITNRQGKARDLRKAFGMAAG